MHIFPKLIAFGGPLLLLLLTAIAGYAYGQSRFLSLPIPQALGLFTVVLPLITGISSQGIHGLIQRSLGNEQYHLTLPLIAVIGFQLIYETVIATLALTFLLPPNALTCSLQTRWRKLYMEKNGRAIRDIQDAFDCCGFFSVKDQAYPFPGQRPSECSVVFRRSKSCFGPWRKAEQINAGLILFVAVGVFVIKVLSIIYLLACCPRFFKQRTSDEADGAEGHSRGAERRLVEEGNADAE